jgi:hypothetical protein
MMAAPRHLAVTGASYAAPRPGSDTQQHERTPLYISFSLLKTSTPGRLP